jgi:hypothetical protein
LHLKEICPGFNTASRKTFMVDKKEYVHDLLPRKSIDPIVLH